MLSGCLGCGEAAPASPSRFVLRGRWERPAGVTVHVEPGGGPAGVDLPRAVERACATWSELSALRLVVRGSPEDADVVVSWQTGEHGPCPLFGVDTSVAHTGPVEPGTYLHLDAERAWDAAGGPDLGAALLHEFGHVLGLGHSPDADALLHSDPSRLDLARSDRDALWTLYGGGALDGSDLVITRDGVFVAALHGLAPPGLTDYTLFDVDADGRDELVLWRTDSPALHRAPGAGELFVMHFGPGAQPVRSAGPFPAFVVPGRPLEFLATAEGQRLCFQRSAAGDLAAHVFDARGVPQPWLAELPAQGEPKTRAGHRGDLDGDGTLETVERPAPSLLGGLDRR